MVLLRYVAHSGLRVEPMIGCPFTVAAQMVLLERVQLDEMVVILTGMCFPMVMHIL